MDVIRSRSIALFFHSHETSLSWFYFILIAIYHCLYRFYQSLMGIQKIRSIHASHKREGTEALNYSKVTSKLTVATL